MSSSPGAKRGQASVSPSRLRAGCASGQTSIEALIAFAALLAAIALLAIHAQSVNSGCSASIDASAEQVKISYAALSLDTFCSSLPSAYMGQKQGAIMAVGRRAIRGSSGIMVSEPVFYGSCVGAQNGIASGGRGSADA